MTTTSGDDGGTASRTGAARRIAASTAVLRKVSFIQRLPGMRGQYNREKLAATGERAIRQRRVWSYLFSRLNAARDEGFMRPSFTLVCAHVNFWGPQYFHEPSVKLARP